MMLTSVVVTSKCLELRSFGIFYGALCTLMKAQNKLADEMFSQSDATPSFAALDPSSAR